MERFVAVVHFVLWPQTVFWTFFRSIWIFHFNITVSTSKKKKKHRIATVDMKSAGLWITVPSLAVVRHFEWEPLYCETYCIARLLTKRSPSLMPNPRFHCFKTEIPPSVFLCHYSLHYKKRKICEFGLYIKCCDWLDLGNGIALSGASA